MDTLTRVEILCWREDSPISLTISIRDSLNGSDIASATVYSSKIPTHATWINFDTPNISVQPYKKYYMIYQLHGGDINNAIYWGIGQNDPYKNGKLWHYNGHIWQSFENYDEKHPKIASASEHMLGCELTIKTQ